MPCPGPLDFSHIADYTYDLCPLPDPDVCLSVLVCDAEHTSFYFGLCDRKFVLCLFGECPGLSTICHSWRSRCLVYAAQPAMILLSVYLSWFFSLRL